MRLRVPVICVGNINAGGTGKTPTVMAVVEHLRGRFTNPMSSHAAMAARWKGPCGLIRRDTQRDEVGDEPLLLAAFAEVWVAKDRAAGRRRARGGRQRDCAG